MLTPERRNQMHLAAQIHDLPADLVEALVLVESGGDPYAWNPEPQHRYF